ncbi:hypothetical protein ANCDUO_01696 [Ancylostoma duodenale]|uniref:Uncharacterized protein n=1 Tax=Ancylostoma duodenale TaxID=51022 RepID=A0A0C2HEK2_9BILA|nr:hypothetical protein ANCDUO_01696 [Ancylostoma duodenale]
MDLPSDRRGFLLKAAEMGMTNDEYEGAEMERKFVSDYVRLNNRALSVRHHYLVSNGLTPVWEDANQDKADGMDDAAKLAAKYMIVLDLNSEGINQTYMVYFKSNVLARVRADPLFCKTAECLTNSNKASQPQPFVSTLQVELESSMGLSMERVGRMSHQSPRVSLVSIAVRSSYLKLMTSRSNSLTPSGQEAKKYI